MAIYWWCPCTIETATSDTSTATNQSRHRGQQTGHFPSTAAVSAEDDEFANTIFGVLPPTFVNHIYPTVEKEDPIPPINRMPPSLSFLSQSILTSSTCWRSLPGLFRIKNRPFQVSLSSPWNVQVDQASGPVLPSFVRTQPPFASCAV